MDFLKPLFASLTWDIVIPTMILGVLFTCGAWVLWRAQQRADFDLAQMLVDPKTMRASHRNAGFFTCLILSSWLMAILALKGLMSVEYFWAYLITWSGSELLGELVGKWNGTVPFSKSNYAAVTATSTMTETKTVSGPASNEGTAP